jgi:hypothetical protein
VRRGLAQAVRHVDASAWPSLCWGAEPSQSEKSVRVPSQDEIRARGHRGGAMPNRVGAVEGAAFLLTVAMATSQPGEP